MVIHRHGSNVSPTGEEKIQSAESRAETCENCGLEKEDHPLSLLECKKFKAKNHSPLTNPTLDVVNRIDGDTSKSKCSGDCATCPFRKETLSDKGIEGMFQMFFWEEDVKNFIKELKEKFYKLVCDEAGLPDGSCFRCVDEIVDKLAGKELVKGGNQDGNKTRKN